MSYAAVQLTWVPFHLAPRNNTQYPLCCNATKMARKPRN
jgi:hypothetical protein